MNSHQRRKDRRSWKYAITVQSGEWVDYIRIFEWCQKNLGPCVTDGWRDPRPIYDTVWKFNCPKKAAIFALRWQ